MAAAMASTALAMAGISFATASATLRSSPFITPSISSVDMASMSADAGLRCSVRRFSIM
jgi:hypothetical protein